MRNSIVIQIITIIILTNTVSYSQSANKLRKMGVEYEKNGYYQKAADNYFRAVKKKPKDVKSHIGLERSATQIINKKTKAIIMAFDSERYTEVINIYNSIKRYQQELSQVEINVETSSSILSKYEESKGVLAETHYQSGKNKLNNGSYSSAIESFKKSLDYKSYYKDANSLISQAKEAKNLVDAERYYNSGLNKFKNKSFRSAYNDFSSCLSYKSSYKDAFKLKSESLEKGTIRVAISTFSDWTNLRGSNELYSNVYNSLRRDKSAFIKLYDKDNLNGVTGEADAIRIAKSKGMDYVILGKITNVRKSGGDLKTQTLEAFELYYVKDDNGKQKPKGRATKFNLYEGSVNVKIEAEYKIFSVKTGSLIKSGTIHDTESDKIKYASYKGDYKKLCLTDPGKNSGSFLGTLLTSFTKVDQSLFTSRRNLNSEHKMKTGILSSLGRQMSKTILSYVDR